MTKNLYDDEKANKLKESRPNKDECSAFCPICGSDLYFTGDKCLCKNKDCTWSCELCRDYKIKE